MIKDDEGVSTVYSPFIRHHVVISEVPWQTSLAFSGAISGQEVVDDVSF